MYQSAGRNGDAIRELERAAAFPPVVGQDHLFDTLGVLYTSDANLDGALTAYRTRVLVNPNNSDAHRKLAQIYLELGRHEEASAEFTAALLLDPMNAEACAGRAQIRLRLGDYADAAKWARAALMLNPTHAAAQYTLGASLMRLGRADEGSAALEEFRRLQAAAQAAASVEWELKLLRQSAQAQMDDGHFGEAAASSRTGGRAPAGCGRQPRQPRARARTRRPLRRRHRRLPQGSGSERRRATFTDVWPPRTPRWAARRRARRNRRSTTARKRAGFVREGRAVEPAPARRPSSPGRQRCQRHVAPARFGAMSLVDVSPVTFRDVASESGVIFTHTNGASPAKHIVETMGSGGLLFDYDGDGWLDVFLVDGGSVVDPRTAAQARSRLFHNRGDGTFDDVTAASKIEHRAYGMGACAADYDNDGHEDLYLTNFGANTLYRNNGDGTFTDGRRPPASAARP